MTGMIGPSGSRFDYSIDSAAIKEIKSASDKEKIGSVASRIWDKIADWFCGTDRTEAKKCLFDLYSEKTSILEKVQSFNRLRDLAGSGYQDRFSTEFKRVDSPEDEAGDYTRYSLNPTDVEGDEIIFESVFLDRDIVHADTMKGRVDQHGNQVHGDGALKRAINVETMIEDTTRFLDEYGYTVDRQGYVWDEDGARVVGDIPNLGTHGNYADDYGNNIDDFGRFVDEQGNVLSKLGEKNPDSSA